jgi:hypothetical protein
MSCTIGAELLPARLSHVWVLAIQVEPSAALATPVIEDALHLALYPARRHT